MIVVKITIISLLSTLITLMKISKSKGGLVEWMVIITAILFIFLA